MAAHTTEHPRSTGSTKGKSRRPGTVAPRGAPYDPGPGNVYALDWEDSSRRTLPPPDGWACEPGPGDTEWRDGMIFIADSSNGYPVRSGRYCVGFDLDKTDPPFHGGTRSEISSWPPEPRGAERWYGISTYLQDWVPDAAADSILQWHQGWDPPSGSPPLAVLTRRIPGTSSFGYYLHREWTPTPGSTLQIDERPLGGSGVADTWVDWVVHVRWSTTNSGLIEVWRDGQKVATINGSTDDYPNPDHLDQSNYLKFGIYKWPWSQANPKPPSEVTHRRMYADQLRIADGTGSYDAVAPRGSGPSSEVLQPNADVPPEPWLPHGAASRAQALTKSQRQPDYVAADSYIWANGEGHIAEVSLTAPSQEISGGSAWFFANTGPTTRLLAQLVVAGETAASSVIAANSAFRWTSLPAPALTSTSAQELAVRFLALDGGDSNVRALYFDPTTPDVDLRVAAGDIPSEVYTDTTGWQNPWIKANEPWLDPARATLPRDAQGQWRSCAPWGQAICRAADVGHLALASLSMSGELPDGTPRSWTWPHGDIDVRYYCRYPWFGTDDSQDAERTDDATSANVLVPGNSETFGVVHFYRRTRPGDIPTGLHNVTVDARLKMTNQVIIQVGFDWYRLPVGGGAADHTELGAGYWYRSAGDWQTAHLSFCGEEGTAEPAYVHCGETPPWQQLATRRGVQMPWAD